MIELLVLLLLCTLWLLPTIVAAARSMPNVGTVAVIDVLLGWTLIGWVVALALACGARPQRHWVGGSTVWQNDPGVPHWTRSSGGPPGASIPPQGGGQ